MLKIKDPTPREPVKVETQGAVCGYCAHPAPCHTPDGCWNDVRGVRGWRRCTCTGWQDAA